MTAEDAYQTILARVYFFVEQLQGLPMVFPNQSDVGVDKTGLWAEFDITMGSKDYVGVGADSRQPGIIRVRLYDKLFAGTEDILASAQTIVESLESRTNNTVHFRAGSVEPFGTDGDHYRVDVVCPFYHEEIGT